MDNQILLKEALAEELGTLYKNVTQLTAVQSLPEDDLQLLRGLVSVLQFAAHQMAEQQASGGQLTADVTLLQEKVAELQHDNAAYQKQLEWIKDRVALSRTATGRTQLRATLKHTLDIAVEITQANSGSLFLLDETNVVTECILTRSGTTERERHNLIGQVMKKGLAGWVLKHRKIETINDTYLDDRWINLADQPYKVRSVICAPMVGHSRIFGIITLTHPEPRHFRPLFVELIEAMADQMTLVLETDHFRSMNRSLESRLRHYQEFCYQVLTTEIVGTVVVQDNKFVYVNKVAAKLFGYSAETLMQLPSITSVIAYEDRAQLKTALQKCHAKSKQILSLGFGITHENGQVIPVAARGIAYEFEGKPAVMVMLNSARQGAA